MPEPTTLTDSRRRKPPLIAFPRLTHWRARRKWRAMLAEIADKAEAEGWTAGQILHANRNARRIYNQAREIFNV